MKKALVAKLALAGAVGLAAAMVSGNAGATDCNACHTMHNSQDGAPMRLDGGATPLPILLLDDCLGCHSGLNATDPETTVGAQPKVLGTALPAYPAIAGATGAANQTLAGGDFWWVNQGFSAKGHNVNGVAAADPLGNVAPGGGNIGGVLECAGAIGCHGNPAITNPLASLQGAHHFQHNTPATGPVAANDIGDSFRFLWDTGATAVDGGGGSGILGIEDGNWQWTEASDDHNQYAGIDRNTATGTAAGSGTISALCARCHGAYHNTVQGNDAFGINEDNTDFTAGQWVRHPTDYDMSAVAGEYANFTTYQPETPVGRLPGNLNAGTMTSVAAGHRIVLCVSCHRAHGSPYDDMLRWDYTTMDVGGGATNGCMNCHTAKS